MELYKNREGEYILYSNNSIIYYKKPEDSCMCKFYWIAIDTKSNECVFFKNNSKNLHKALEEGLLVIDYALEAKFISKNELKYLLNTRQFKKFRQ